MLIASIGSFVVYLAPLIGPHAVWLFGESLVHELSGRVHHEAVWIAADLALALAAQTTAGLVLLWSLGGRLVRLVVLVFCVPVLYVTLATTYLIAIPSHFLIEPDTAPEVQNWTERCVVPDASLMQVRRPITLAVSGVGEWWVQRSDGRLGLLEVPGCDVLDPKIPQPVVQPSGRVDFSFGLQFSLSGGSAIFERYDTGTSRRTWWLLTSPAMHLVPIVEPSDKYEGAPILSNTGDSVAWLAEIAGTGPPVLQRVLIRSIENQPARATEIIVDLTSLGPAQYVLLEVDTISRQVVLWKNDGLLVVGFDGTRLERSASTSPILPQSSTFVRTPHGWLAWDAYQEEDPYQLAWMLTAGKGRRRVTKGRSITSATVDPSGRFIAISTTTTLSLGHAPDEMYVIRAQDGTEAFRRYLPRYSRSAVVFFESGLFGYSEGGLTHILTVREQ
ncbi:MAG: hypothetical protein C5B57_07005 [Blastocatellia bacterium]|nr:MAG: hypothetical protein C5B57_07005 [Blastocatellia bacterium]